MTAEREGTMVELSEATRERLQVLFRPEDLDDAERLLVESCAENLPLIREPTSQGLERIRFAALRASGGDLERLREAVRLAQIDWRDVLVGAGFGHDPAAHRHWQPRRFDRALAARWGSGEPIEGVDLRVRDRVEVAFGPSRGATATVVALLGLEPEARFLVEIGSGERREVYRRMLQPASSDRGAEE